MRPVIDPTENPVLMRWRREVLAKGMSKVLRNQIRTKFGTLPKWTSDRIANASPVQIDRWAKRVLTADTIEGVLGKR